MGKRITAMKKDHISRALADTYHQAAIAGRDMRRVADQLENLRESIAEKPLYAAWRDIDRAVGQVLLQDNMELFGILNTFRKSFVDWAYDSARVRVKEGFEQNREAGWQTFLDVYIEALVNWRFQIYGELYKDLDLESIPEAGMDLYLKIARATPYMLETRWDEAYGLFLELADLPGLPTGHKVHLLCSAGQIELYFFSNSQQARALFEKARAVEKDTGTAFSRTEQSFGELYLQEWPLDKARDAFQKAAQLDAQNEFALLYMGDTYREESRYSIAKAWYEDAQNLFPGSPDVFIRLIRLFERRDYFEDNDPSLIRTYIDRITLLMPEERYSALIDAGFAFQSNDRLGEAERWYREVIDAFPDRGGGWINLGYILEKQKRYPESREAFLQALRLDSEHFEAHWGLAYLYERMEGMESEALRTLETCKELRPQWAVFILPRIAELQLRLGESEKGVALLLECLKRFPDQDADPLRILHEEVNRRASEPEGASAAIGLLEQTLEARGREYADNFANRVGNVHFQNGRFDLAAGQYREAIGIHADVPIYHYNLGLALDRLEQYEPAAEAFEKYLSLESAPSADNLNSIGIFYYKKLQQHERAAALYQRAIEQDPANDNYHYNLALVQERLGQISEAEASYLSAIECDPGDPENHNGLGVFYFGRQRYEEAVREYQKAIDLHDGEALYFANMGLAWQQLGRSDEEMAAYQKAATLHPRYFLETGRCYFNQKHYEEAIEAIRQAGEYLDQFPFHYAYLGLSFENLGDKAQAEATFRQAIGKDPNLDDYFYNRLGILCYQQGRDEEAETCYREAIRLNPLAVYHENLGLALEKLEKEEDAEAAYSKCLELEPQNGVYYNRMGIFYYSRGHFEQAISWYQKAIERDPANPVFRNNLALALEASQQLPEAEQAYLAAIERDPANAEYLNFYGAMLFRSGRFPEARDYFERAAAGQPSNALFLTNLGLACLNLNDPAAVDALRRALALQPGDAQIQSFLDLAEQLLGQG